MTICEDLPRFMPGLPEQAVAVEGAPPDPCPLAPPASAPPELAPPAFAIPPPAVSPPVPLNPAPVPAMPPPALDAPEFPLCPGIVVGGGPEATPPLLVDEPGVPPVELVGLTPLFPPLFVVTAVGGDAAVPLEQETSSTLHIPTKCLSRRILGKSSTSTSSSAGWKATNIFARHSTLPLSSPTSPQSS